MPPSQLKRLKSSLREQGITGPQKSKKQKKRDSKNVDQKARRGAALQNIRDSFNPFEVKALNRPKKFDVFSNKSNVSSNCVVGRPGVTKSMGEETRLRTLLPEIQRRNKVGGIVDRRIGENDPTMTPEERALQRFTREKQKRKGNLFDLEEAEDEAPLTHLGRTLEFDAKAPVLDDFDAGSLGESEADGTDDEGGPRKRRRAIFAGEPDGEASAEEDGPERKKTKQEVYKEIIAKSKLHKYERQQAKEEDDALREELDQDLQSILGVLKGHIAAPVNPPAAPEPTEYSMNPERAALLNGADRALVEKEYDERIRQMRMDKRAAPTERTKTAEEKASEEAQKLKDLEARRLRRMRGEESEDEDAPRQDGGDDDLDVLEEEERDDAAEFGFTNVEPAKPTRRELDVEDEDDFVIEDDLVASGSELDTDVSDAEESDAENSENNEDDDDEFVRGILDDTTKTVKAPTEGTTTDSKLAYTYPCPRSHEEFLEVISNVQTTDVPTIVQRIRALYHPQLAAENKEKLADFSVALVDHLVYMMDKSPPQSVVETLIRHLHSLSRTYPDIIGKAFREHLRRIHEAKTIKISDLSIFTAIGSIYPTSDHFHPVVTPAITIMARWLGLTLPSSEEDMRVGSYLVALSLSYQKLSKRYIPEVVRFTNQALKSPLSQDLVKPFVTSVIAMADLWKDSVAFIEVFSPALVRTLSQVKSKESKDAIRRLQIQLSQARLARRPLELHHHKPLAIKTSIPKFEEGFDPNKHYDPDKERSDAAKLRAEYKRERKGALRELRKDANFLARQQLREKKEKDHAYEEKYRKLVATIQTEEGREANAYDREKAARKGKR